jgi:hypothetical protein|tara:strand:+ start:3632 stop:11188 length:7557 start_codon:yes stop_codon:yes gene_type:complete
MNQPLHIITAHNSALNGGLPAILKSDSLKALRREYADQIPASWIEHCADVLALSPSSNALEQATDLWLVHRLTEQQIKDDVLPYLAELPAFAAIPASNQIEQWRGLYQPLQRHFRSRAARDRLNKAQQPVTGTTPSILRAILAKHFGEKAIAALMRQQRLHIISSAAELPDLGDSRGSVDSSAVVGATYPDGSVYLVADKITPQNAAGVFLHEVGEHAGMATMLGRDYGRLVQHFRRLQASGDAYAAYATMRVPHTTPDADVPSEQLAYLIEKVANDQVAMQGGEGGYALGQECLSHLRNWIFRTPTAQWLDSVNALEDFTLRPQDIAALARESVATLSGTTQHTSIGADWAELLDSQQLDDLFYLSHTQRIEQLDSCSPEVLAGYLYALTAMRAPDLGITLDYYMPAVARMAAGENGPHLTAIAGDLIATSAKLDIGAHLQANLADGGVMVLKAPNGSVSSVSRNAVEQTATVAIWPRPGVCSQHKDVPLSEVVQLLPRLSQPVPSDEYASTLAAMREAPQRQLTESDSVQFAVGNAMTMPASSLLNASAALPVDTVRDEPAVLTGQNPLVNDPGASMISVGTIIEAIGAARGYEMLQCEEVAVYDTPAWKQAAEQYGVRTVDELQDAAPEVVSILELPAARIFSRQHYRDWFAEAGFDYAQFMIDGVGPASIGFKADSVVGASAAAEQDNTDTFSFETGRYVLHAMNKLVEKTRWSNEVYDHYLTIPVEDRDDDAASAVFDASTEMHDAQADLKVQMGLSPMAGAEGLTRDGRAVLLTPSSKTAGYWQVTRMGTNGQPYSDSLLPSKEQGAQYLLEEIDPATLTVYGLTPGPLKPGAEPKFTFGGENARIALLNDLQTAINMIGAGADEKEVLRDTGWFMGYDGRWRFEITDHNALLHYPDATAQQVAVGGAKTVADFLSHRRLFAAYPELAEIPVLVNSKGETSLVSYSDGRLEMKLRDTLQGPELLGALLHELQHGIQLLEGFAIGGSEKDFKKLDITDKRTQPINARIQSLLEGNPEYAEKQRQANRMYADLVGRYPLHSENGVGIDWEWVPPAKFETYMALRDELEQFPEHDEYFDLDDERSRLERDRAYLYPYQQYLHLAGELEARTVEYRALLTENERRLVHPHANGDVQDLRDLIFVFEPGFTTRHAAIAARESAKAQDDQQVRFSVDAPEHEQRTWFYSALDKAVDRIHTIAGKNGEVLPAQALAWLKSQQKQGAFKKEELEWSGIEEWLAGQRDKIHSDTIKAFMVANAVQLVEVGFGHSPERKLDFDARYPSMVLPNHYGYRELLLCLPSEWGQPQPPERPTELPDSFTVETITNLGQTLYLVNANDGWGSDSITGAYNGIHPTRDDAINAALDRLHEGAMILHNRKNGPAYSQSHWPSMPNVIAHLRCTDRIDSNGRVHLFVEEIQSDWAQSGRKYGFKEEFVPAVMPVFTAEETTIGTLADSLGLDHSDVLKRVRRGIRTKKENYAGLELDSVSISTPIISVSSNGVPSSVFSHGTPESAIAISENQWRAAEEMRRINHVTANHIRPVIAPFVTDTKAWTSLVVRRAFMFAAQHGYEAVSFINGEQAAIRAKQISHIESAVVIRGNTDYFNVSTYDRDGNAIVEGRGANASTLKSLVGEKLAKQLIDSEPDTYRFTGLNTRAGGEGMIDFYDNIVPTCVRDVLRKNDGPMMMDALVQTDYESHTRQLSVNMTTDFSMRVKQQGMPLFSLNEENAIKRAAELELAGDDGAEVFYVAEPVADTQETALFKSGMGSRTFTSFDDAWREASRAHAQGEAFKVTPAIIRMSSPMPNLYREDGLVSRDQLLAMLSKAAVDSLLPDFTDLTRLDDLLSNPFAIEVFKAAGFDGARYRTFENGVLTTRQVVFTKEAITEGRAMVLSDSASAQQPRLSMRASAALNAATRPTPTQLPIGVNVAARVQEGHKGALPITTRISDLPGVMFDTGSFSDIAGLYREATAGLRDEVDKLESRLAWLNKGRQQDSDIADRTRAKLAATQAELARLKPAVMPSKHSMLAWDELITNGQRKALASSIAFQNDLPVTGKEAFWLAAATHGGYDKAIAAMRKAGIVGVSQAENMLVWDQSAHVLQQHLPTVDASVRFHLAYHGSPHLFSEFSNDYLGTGEGAQSYGKGLYLADTIATATHYQMMGLKKTSLFGSTVHATLDSLIEAATDMAVEIDPALKSHDPREIKKTVGQFLSARLISRTYSEPLINRDPAYTAILNHLNDGVRFYDTSFDDFRVLPHTGSFALNEIMLSDDSNMRTGLFAIETRLNYLMGRSRTDDELQEILDRHVAEVTDVAEAKALIQRLETGLSDKPDDEFLLDRLGDAKWSLHMAECAVQFVEKYGPLSVLRPSDKGHIYMVDIAIKDAQYLLHDLPFNDQSDQVRSALLALSMDTSLDQKYRDQLDHAIARNATGADLYGALFADPVSFDVDAEKEDKAVAALVAQGVRGIKYWDGNTRNDENKQHNYVVFDAKDLSVLGRQQDRVYGPDYFDAPQPAIAASMGM